MSKIKDQPKDKPKKVEPVNYPDYTDYLKAKKEAEAQKTK